MCDCNQQNSSCIVVYESTEWDMGDRESNEEARQTNEIVSISSFTCLALTALRPNNAGR